MTWSPGQWVTVRDDLFDALVKRTRNCQLEIIDFWRTDWRPFVVMEVAADYVLLCPVVSDPGAKAPGAAPFPLHRGDGAALKDTFLHIEVALWAPTDAIAPYRSGPLPRDHLLPPRRFRAAVYQFNQLWAAQTVAGLPRE